MATFSASSMWMWGGSDAFAEEDEDGQEIPAEQEV